LNAVGHYFPVQLVEIKEGLITLRSPNWNALEQETTDIRAPKQLDVSHLGSSSFRLIIASENARGRERALRV
jgi:hypothetical protein